MFTFTFNAEEAGLADLGQRIKTGGYYKGSITMAEVKPKEKGYTLEMELTSDAGESTGRLFFVLTTQAGLTVDKNGKILSGRSKLSALLALLGLKVMVDPKELIGKKIGFLGKMKKTFSEKEGKDFLNFDLLNFMHYGTDQTYTEKLKQQPPERCKTIVIDDIITENQTPNHQNEQSDLGVNIQDLPF